MIRLDDLPRFYIGTRKAYESHKNNNDLDPNGWYFIVDTNEVIFEDKNYNHLMLYYTGSLPEVKTPNRIYFNLTTLEVHLWNGIQWIQVFSPPDVTLISTTGTNSRVVSGEVVKDYADRIIKETLNELVSFKTFTFNPETRCLNVHIGNSNKSLDLSCFASSITSSNNDYSLQLRDRDGNILSSVILYPCHIAQGKFNIETLTLDFYYSTDRPICSIPISELFNLLQSKDTSSIITSISPNDRSFLSMDVRLSELSDNQLIMKDDGLYLNWDQYIDKVHPDKQGSIITFDNKGNSKVISGITNIVEKDSDKVVTEDGVYNTLSSIYTKLATDEDIWDDQLGFNHICNSLRVRKV